MLPNRQIWPSSCVHCSFKLLALSSIYVGFAGLVVAVLPHIGRVVLQERWHWDFASWSSRLLAPLTLRLWLGDSKLSLSYCILLILAPIIRTLVWYQGKHALALIATIWDPVLSEKVVGFGATLLVDWDSVQTWSCSCIYLLGCNSIQLVLQKRSTPVAIQDAKGVLALGISCTHERGSTASDGWVPT